MDSRWPICDTTSTVKNTEEATVRAATSSAYSGPVAEDLREEEGEGE